MIREAEDATDVLLYAASTVSRSISDVCPAGAQVIIGNCQLQIGSSDSGIYHRTGRDVSIYADHDSDWSRGDELGTMLTSQTELEEGISVLHDYETYTTGILGCGCFEC